MNKIYLDNAATTLVKKEVLKAMMPYFSHQFGNASSIHGFGREAKIAIEKAREDVAKYLNCQPKEIIFTSGGTESDNLAIRGLVNATSYLPRRQTGKLQATSDKPHIITSAFEHHAVLDTCKDLEERGLAEVTYIKPDNKGIIDVEDIKQAIKKNTVLISIMYVNNEIGTVQPIEKIGNIIKKSNKLQATRYKLIFHTDAVQAVGYQNCDIEKLGVDMLTISAHKFGGPKGVGVLFVKDGVKLHRENIGGAQERNLRAGTYNTPGIIGMARAIKLLQTQNSKLKTQSLLKLRDYFIEKILKEIPDTFLNGDRVKRNPNNVNISFKYIEGEAILLHLDKAGIAASSGSACTSGSLDPSHVLLAIGLKHEEAHGSIRFTLGDTTIKEDIDYTISILKKTVRTLRSMSPFGE